MALGGLSSCACTLEFVETPLFCLVFFVNWNSCNHGIFFCFYLKIWGDLKAMVPPLLPSSQNLFIYLFIYLIYIWLLWVFTAAHGLSLVAASGGYSSLWCAGFSLRWLLLLRNTGSRRTGFNSCGSQALECRLSSCGARD